MKDEKLKDLLFHKEDGFLIKFHFKKGLDIEQLDDLYKILEEFKLDWKNKEYIPKSIVFHLFPIISSLRRDLQLYSSNEELFCKYEEQIDALDDAIYMCLNPDINDPHFNIPLKELSNI